MLVSIGSFQGQLNEQLQRLMAFGWKRVATAHSEALNDREARLRGAAACTLLHMGRSTPGSVGAAEAARAAHVAVQVLREGDAETRL
jgi:hypothetical protein